MSDMMRGGMMGLMGNDDKTMADSFQGGVDELEQALIDADVQEIDELASPRKQMQNQEQQGQDQMLMMLMQALGGGGM